MDASEGVRDTCTIDDCECLSIVNEQYTRTMERFRWTMPPSKVHSERKGERNQIKAFRDADKSRKREIIHSSEPQRHHASGAPTGLRFFSLYFWSQEARATYEKDRIDVRDNAT